jgi:hypothetical protein
MEAVTERDSSGKVERQRRRGLLGAGIDRVAGAVVPAVTRSVDAEELLDRIDLDALLERVDLDRVLARLDIDALVQRVDVDALVQRVDVDALVQRVDVDALVRRVDVDALVQRVDVDALVQRVDVAALVERAAVGDIISRSTGEVASNTLDLLRRQLVGLDVIALRFVNRVLRRDPASLPAGPPMLVRAG